MKYSVDNKKLSLILLSIKKELKEAEETIERLLEIDYKYSNIKINLKQLEDVLDMLKNEKLDTQNEQKVLIRYNGDPVITLNLSVLAILTKTVIFLDFNQNALGLNTLIINIVNKVLTKFETEQLIYLQQKSSFEDEKIDKIICIDDIYKYNEYLRKKNKKAKFYSFNYLDFYNDSDELDDIAELIYKYAEENQIYVESYSEVEPEEAAKMINKGLGRYVVLLTKSKEVEKIFQRIIINKKLYINKNPYNQPNRLIDKEIFYI